MFNAKEIASRDYGLEFTFQTSRSSGPGGQHANKVETRVTLRFNPKRSEVLSDKEKNRLLLKWKSKLTLEGELLVHSEKHRSQVKNKEHVIQLFGKLLLKAFTDPKPRKKTKPKISVIKERLDKKKKQGQKKAMRRPPEF